jgi:glycine dehydrogenase
MLKSIGFDNFQGLVESTVPSNILTAKPLDLAPALTETEALESLEKMIAKNKVMKNYIGMGYYETLVSGITRSSPHASSLV